MSDQRFDINGLRVASPCSVNWDSMTGDERSRHCDLCSLNVFNVSELSEAEVARLIAQSTGRICMRMYRRADGTVLTRDCPVGVRAVRKRIARSAGATLAAVLGLFSISFGQKTDAGSDQLQSRIVRSLTPFPGGQLRGKVVDPLGGVIGGARVVLSTGRHETVAISDTEGRYELTGLIAGKYDLKVTSSNFAAFQMRGISVDDREQLLLNVVLHAVALMGVIDCVLPEDDLDFTSAAGVTIFRQKMIDGIPH